MDDDQGLQSRRKFISAMAGVSGIGMVMQSGCTDADQIPGPNDPPQEPDGDASDCAAEGFANVVNVRAHGARAKSGLDDRAAFQSAINDAIAKGVALFIPVGNYRISGPLQINAPLIIQGAGQFNTIVHFIGESATDSDGKTYQTGSDGFIVEGESIGETRGIQMRDFEIAHSSRYAPGAKENNHSAVLLKGAQDRPMQYHCYRNVFIDGFHTAFDSNYLTACHFENVRTAFCLKGIVARGKHFNNTVANCQFNVNGFEGSRCIEFTGDVPAEGWLISNSLLYGARIAIASRNTAHVFISNTLLDAIQETGILLEASGRAYSSNWGISNNYIGMGAPQGRAIAASAAIVNNNAAANERNIGNRIVGNMFIVYQTSSCAHGYLGNGAASNSDMLTGNTFRGFAKADIYAPGRELMVVQNRCLSPLQTGANIVGGGVVEQNVGRHVP